jgi:NitT/TauT family transport system ATP-binding protein
MRDLSRIHYKLLRIWWDGVLLAAEILGLSLKAARERAHELLTTVELSGFADKYPYELSGGMQAAGCDRLGME